MLLLKKQTSSERITTFCVSYSIAGQYFFCDGGLSSSDGASCTICWPGFSSHHPSGTLLTPNSIRTSSLCSTIEQSIEYMNAQKKSSRVNISLKIFSSQEKTIFCRDSVFMHALKNIVRSPHRSTTSKVDPWSCQIIHCTTSSLIWAILEDWSALEITPKVPLLYTQTVMNVFPTVVMICNHFAKIYKDCAENTRDSIVNGRSKSENV